MQMVLIQFKRYGEESSRDICITKNQPSADKYVNELKSKYPSYLSGEFSFKKIKYIRN